MRRSSFLSWLVFGLALGVLRNSADQRLAGLGESMRQFFDAGAEVTLVAGPVSRVIIRDPESTADEFVALAEDLGLHGTNYVVGWTAWLDIAPQGVDTSTALERVRTWLGVPPDRVLVMGDGRNDVGMFRWAQAHGGRAIAMGQGPDEVRRAAGETTASVHSGGVADVLRAL